MACYTITGKLLREAGRHGVYVWRRGEEWLYVGASVAPLRRLASHNLIGRVEPLQDDDRIEFYPSETFLVLEAQLIAQHQPKYNQKPIPLNTPVSSKACISCGKTFQQTRAWQRWCSLQCRIGVRGVPQ